MTEAAEAGDFRAIEAFIDRGGDLETRDSRLGAVSDEPAMNQRVDLSSET